MFEVSVSGWFAAAHQLRLPDGSLEPLHGHNWHVTVTFAGPRLDECGLLLDFVALRRRLEAVLGQLHDRNLNELAAFAGRNPSAEQVAVWIAGQFGAGQLGGGPAEPGGQAAAGGHAAAGGRAALGGAAACAAGGGARAAARLACVEVEEAPGCRARYLPPGA